MTPPIIATGADSNLFWLAKGLVLSLAAARRAHGLPMAFFDLGLAPGQGEWLRSQGVAVLAPPDPLGIAGMDGFRPYMLGQFCRPFLPEILPGHAGHIWLDADTWVQQEDGVGAMLHMIRHGRAACCPELHAAYSSSGAGARRVQAFWHKRWTEVFGAEAANLHACVPMINSGVVAAPAGHGIWARWQAELRRAAARPLTHLSEQFAFFLAALDQGDMERLPAHWNWLANFCTPRWHPRTGLWIEPAYPHQPIRIVHLAGARLRPRFLAQRILFDRGAYLDPAELPEAPAPRPEAAATA